MHGICPQIRWRAGNEGVRVIVTNLLALSEQDSDSTG